MSTWQSVCFGCGWSVKLQLSACLPPSQSTSGSSGARLSARLQLVSIAAQCHVLCSSALHCVRPGTVCQLSCILSAQLQSICCSVFCHAVPLVTHQLPEISSALKCKAPLQSVISATICLLSHDLSAWQQSVNAVCQLSCNTAAQLQIRPVSSEQTRQLCCQVSCNILAELQHVLIWTLSTHCNEHKDIWKRQINEACNNHVAHCCADALLQILAILAKQVSVVKDGKDH